MLRCLLISLIGFIGPLIYGQDFISALEKKVLATADSLMQRFSVSYAYGGNQILSQEHCKQCTACLESQPKSKSFNSCPQCQGCSIDCSHFVHLVFSQNNLKFPYLPTDSMLNLSQNTLASKYQLRTISWLAHAKPGDFLVYHGHVVLLEHMYNAERGDVIHATGGRVLRGPGLGIQRERNVDLEAFRGPLLRILRHKDLDLVVPTSQSNKVTVKLKPIPKR